MYLIMTSGWGLGGGWVGAVCRSCRFFVPLLCLLIVVFYSVFCFGAFRKGGTALWVLAPKQGWTHIALCGSEQAVRLYAASELWDFSVGVVGPLLPPPQSPSWCRSFCSLLKETLRVGEWRWRTEDRWSGKLSCKVAWRLLLLVLLVDVFRL